MSEPLKASDLLAFEDVVSFEISLWGASINFIDAVAQGARERGAACEATVCPAYAGVQGTFPSEDEGGVRQYLRRMAALAIPAVQATRVV